MSDSRSDLSFWHTVTQLKRRPPTSSPSPYFSQWPALSPQSTISSPPSIRSDHFHPSPSGQRLTIQPNHNLGRRYIRTSRNSLVWWSSTYPNSIEMACCACKNWIGSICFCTYCYFWYVSSILSTPPTPPTPPIPSLPHSPVPLRLLVLRRVIGKQYGLAWSHITWRRNEQNHG
jgi:hypothetical protein